MSNKNALNSLTSLKGIFIVIILLHNTFSIDPLFDRVPGVSFLTLYGGEFGNSIFFMISGYLLACSYQDRIRNGQISFKSYLVRRLQKLYPLYLLSNLVALLIDIFRYGPSAIVLTKVAFTCLLQMGSLSQGNPYNSPTWFLSALFVCYLLFYGICRKANSTEKYWAAILGMVILGYYFSISKLQLPFCRSGIGIGYLNFFLGCALANLFPCIPVSFRRNLKLLALLAIGSSFILMLKFGAPIIAGNLTVTCAIFISPMILYLSLTEGWIQRFLLCKPLYELGQLSHFLFFWHLPVYYLFCDILSTVIFDFKISEVSYIGYLVTLFTVCLLTPALMKTIAHLQSEYVKKHTL